MEGLFFRLGMASVLLGGGGLKKNCKMGGVPPMPPPPPPTPTPHYGKPWYIYRYIYTHTHTHTHNFTICDIIWGEILFDLYILQWKFSSQKWGRGRGARESGNLSRICLIYCLFLWMWEGVAKLIIFCRCHKWMTPTITFITSAFPRKICRLHLRHFWNKIPCLIRACFWLLNAEVKV